jgi:hypothetical protein
MPRRPTIELQNMQRPAASLHEELRRADLQIRVSHVHEILRKEIMNPSHQSQPL